MRFTGKWFILCVTVEFVGQDLRPLVPSHRKYCLGNVSTVFSSSCTTSIVLTVPTHHSESEASFFSRRGRNLATPTVVFVVICGLDVNCCGSSRSWRKQKNWQRRKKILELNMSEGFHTKEGLKDVQRTPRWNQSTINISDSTVDGKRTWVVSLVQMSSTTKILFTAFPSAYVLSKYEISIRGSEAAAEAAASEKAMMLEQHLGATTCRLALQLWWFHPNSTFTWSNKPVSSMGIEVKLLTIHKLQGNIKLSCLFKSTQKQTIPGFSCAFWRVFTGSLCSLVASQRVVQNVGNLMKTSKSKSLSWYTSNCVYGILRNILPRAVVEFQTHWSSSATTTGKPKSRRRNND